MRGDSDKPSPALSNFSQEKVWKKLAFHFRGFDRTTPRSSSENSNFTANVWLIIDFATQLFCIFLKPIYYQKLSIKAANVFDR